MRADAINSWLRWLYDEPPGFALSEGRTLVPTVVVGNLGDPYYHPFPEQGDRLAMGRISQAGGGAGANAEGGFFNPDGSGVVALLERLTIRTSAADNVDLYDASAVAAFGTAGARLFRDLRFRPSGRDPTCVVVSQQGAAAATPILRIRTEADVLLPLDLGIILTMGQAIALRPATNTVTLDVNWFWRERDRYVT